ncbi:sigma-70 family RNA polymerase sigma factor [Paracidovorax cattleyae]|uniref:sigma-70 family RNA polymerase sigma factor n=1 Tax=Paracidovorax cattleyae TaxID=80868 RepID=UPI0018B0146B|nr:sigma-70 family RNA polymerase sigma factor [Paracidovorax cattleyae]MBF9264680.1 sigma-70 family RNA polymerase sigma factor [Paracidovorax cattleyae]
MASQQSQGVAALYCSHHSWLQSWLERRLGHAADAADLAQDAFIRLIRSPLSFENPGSARSYLRKLAGGLCVDLWRRRQIEQAWLDTLTSLPEDLVPSAEHQAIVLQTMGEIDRMLNGISAKAATAFVLAVGCEMTDNEVAEQVGVSPRMVRKYVAAAMAHCIALEIRASSSAGNTSDKNPEL